MSAIFANVAPPAMAPFLVLVVLVSVFSLLPLCKLSRSHVTRCGRCYLICPVSLVFSCRQSVVDDVEHLFIICCSIFSTRCECLETLQRWTLWTQQQVGVAQLPRVPLGGHKTSVHLQWRNTVSCTGLSSEYSLLLVSSQSPPVYQYSGL